MPRSVNLTVHPNVKQHQVSRYIYSQFAEHLGRCIYGGVWVGPDSTIENVDGIRVDTTAALKKIQLPAVRWPGGCFADNYHWWDGIGPRKERPRRYNLWWRQAETNQFGTHEFMQFCDMIDTDPYICLNVGSGTVEEARSWVEYCNASQDTSWVQRRRENGRKDPFGVKFWGIGNESWGCGGGMRAGYYADLYRQYATYIKPTAGDGAKLIACGSHDNLPDWDAAFLDAMKGKLDLVDGLALHIYTGWGMPNIDFTDADYYKLISLVDNVDRNLARACGLVQAYSTREHKIHVMMDEWGTWFREAVTENGLYQQSTMQDALFAAASFHMFHRHGADLMMTNMAQTINVLQALILTEGPKMLVTPTYHIFDMFMPHRDGYLLPVDLNSPELKLTDKFSREAVSVSATQAEDGSVFVSLINLSLDEEFEIDVNFALNEAMAVQKIRLLTSPDIRNHNTFDAPETVKPVELPVATITDGKVNLPAKSVMCVSFA
ncbi:alpha-N-arabinofuranosidase [bacterium]|nr:alpha-N-arabinofuranosidase [bacterium]